MASVILGQTPEGKVLFGLALPLLGLIAVLAGRGARRRLSLALWAVIVMMGWLITLMSSGALKPLVATPTEAGVIVSAAFAGLAGLAVGAFRLDLPRRGFGWVHWTTLGGFATALFLVVAGIGPAVPERVVGSGSRKRSRELGGRRPDPQPPRRRGGRTRDSSAPSGSASVGLRRSRP